MKNKIIFLLAMLSPLISHAEITPYSMSQDNHVQTIAYDANNVIRVRTSLGKSTLIQFEKGESLNDPSAGMGMGDSLAWDVAVRENNLFIKPKADAPDTNMTLVTNKRTYLFNLTTAHGREATTYILRFVYPKENGLGFGNNPYKEKSAPCSGGVKNTQYVMWGDQTLAPSAAWDNGQFACFKYPNGKLLPAFFKIMPDGSEALLNSHIDGDTLVIHGIPSEYRARLGNSVLGIKNQNNRIGYFNNTGTSIPGRQRVQLKEAGDNE